jgi:hypothetical protein
MSDISLPDIDFFSGTLKRGKYQAEPFFEKIQQTFALVDWNDAARLDYFWTCLKPNSPAEIWFEDLPETSTATWDALQAVFIKKFLPDTKPAPTTTETQPQSQGHVTTGDDVPKTVEKGHVHENRHNERADSIQQPTSAIQDDNRPLLTSTPVPTLQAPLCDRNTTDRHIRNDGELEEKVRKGGKEENTDNERVNDVQELTAATQDDEGLPNASSRFTPPPLPSTPVCRQPTIENTRIIDNTQPLAAPTLDENGPLFAFPQHTPSPTLPAPPRDHSTTDDPLRDAATPTPLRPADTGIPGLSLRAQQAPSDTALCLYGIYPVLVVRDASHLEPAPD